MAAPTVYRSVDPSAPVLTGEAGKLIAVLDACLVNGYGAKPAAGWTKAFSGTANQAAYRQGSGPLWYVSVDDSGPDAGTFKEARVSMFTSMTAWNTGTDKTPASTAYIYPRKSLTLDATPKTWMVVADSATVYLFIKGGLDDATIWNGTMWGDFIPIAATDPNRGIIIGRASANSSNPISEQFAAIGLVNNALTGNRLVKNLAGSTDRNMAKCGDYGAQWNRVPWPNLYDNAIYVTPVLISEYDTTSLRGRMRGLWQLCNTMTGVIGDGDTFDAGGEYAGKTFMSVQGLYDSPLAGYVMDLTDWNV